MRRGRLFVLHTSNSYSNPYATPIPACHRARSVLLLSPDNLAFFPGEMAERSFLLRATSILVTNFRVHHLSLFLKTWANVGESYCTEECSKRTLTESSFLSHFVRDRFLFCVLPYMADSDVTQTSSWLFWDRFSKRWECNFQTATNHSSVKMDFSRLLTLVLSVLFVGKVLSFL